MFDRNKYYIIDGQTLKRVITICKNLTDENPIYKDPIKELMRTLLMLDEIDEIRDLGNMDDMSDEDMMDIALQIGRDIESIEELNEKIFWDDYKDHSQKKEDGITLKQMLKNLKLKLPKDKK